MNHSELAAAWLPRVRSLYWGESSRFGDDGESAAVWGLVLAAERYRPDGVHAFSTWAIPYVRAEVRGHARRELRHGRRGLRHLGGEDPFRSREPDPLAAGGARLDAEALLDGLPPRSRRAIELTVMDGLTNAHAARTLGVAESTLRLAKESGLKAIRARFGPAA